MTSQRIGAVIIPLKSFGKAKERLASVLSPARRERLARHTAESVVRAALALPDVHRVLVVADDQDGVDWAVSMGAESMLNDEGLNPSVDAAYRRIADEVSWVMIAHADLVHPERLASLPSPGPDQVIIVRDRHRTGTNVMTLPAGRAFNFHYGTDSAECHRQECAERNLRPVEVLDDRLAMDIDTPEDLLQLPAATRASLGLQE